MKIPENILRLMVRCFAGEASPDEIRALETETEKDPRLAAFTRLLLATRDAESPVLPAGEIALAFEKHRARIDAAERKTAEPAAVQAVPAVAAVKRDRPRAKRYRLFCPGVFANNSKVIWRNLFRNKGFSAINISGLAIGMASAILILLMIGNEISSDQFHEKKDRIFIVFNNTLINGTTETWGGTPAVLAPLLKANYPQVEEVGRLNGTGGIVLSAGEKNIEGRGTIVDASFLRIFSFPLIHGNAGTALSGPRNIVLTQKFARRLFGTDDVMGKLIRIDSNANFIVSGVLKDFPSNTGFASEYLLPWSYMKEVGWDNPAWSALQFNTYVLLKPGVDGNAFSHTIRNLIHDHTSDVKSEIFLYPLTRLNLYSEFKNGKESGGKITSVRLFAGLATFILLIACINYMNLSTAKSVKRAREVGIRKVVGSGRMSILLRFLGESILIAAIGCGFSLALVYFSLDGFNWLMGVDESLQPLRIPWHDTRFWFALVGFVLVTGILAGSYPAFYLSTFRPVSVLKGTFRTAGSLVNIRKVLVVLQFSFAITFIICTIVVYRQIRLGQSTNPGYNRDHLGFVYVKGEMNRKYQLIRRDLLASGAVTSVTRSNSPVCYTWRGDNKYEWTGKNPNNTSFFSEFHIDDDFLETTGIRLSAGRTISMQKFPTDSSAVLLNESAVREMGFKEPVGQIIRNAGRSWTVVGVVKDFSAGSPFYPAHAMILTGPRQDFGAISFRLSRSARMASSMETVEAIFKKHIPDYPILSNFVDEADKKKIEGERRFGVASGIFCGLTILISCLGLFALAAYTAENRIKEIGVRKVLGASVASVMALLSRDFLKLVLLSFLIASPLAWWAMHMWLQSYEIRVNISWWIFLLTGFLSLFIAGFTISFQAVRAALASPVRSLRAE